MIIYLNYFIKIRKNEIDLQINFYKEVNMQIKIIQKK